MLSLPIPRTRQNAVSFHTASNFCTIHLGSVTGLTFLIDYHARPYSVHGHTEERPRAVPPMEKLSEESIKELTWIYVPLAKGDRVKAIEKGPRIEAHLPYWLS